MQNRLAVFRTGVSEDRRLFMDLIERLWERSSAMDSDSPPDFGGSGWSSLAEASAMVLAALAPSSPPGAGKADAVWWELAAGAGFRVTVGERRIHPAGRRGVAALETAFLFAMLEGFRGGCEEESVEFQWSDGTPAVSGRLPGGGTAVLAASRRGVEAGGLGMITGMVRRRRGGLPPEVVLEAILPTTADRVLAVRLSS
jgi:hypothetical protein